jgi:hypothetical protein
VVGQAGDHRVVFVDRHDALDDADWNTGPLERAALLDVQFQVTVMRTLGAPGLGNAFRIAADLFQRVGATHAVPDLIEISRDEMAGRDGAAGEPLAEREALFMRPDDHLQRMTRADAGRGKRLDDAEGGQRSEIAVEVATVRHRVDVRSEQNRRASRIRAGAAAEDVAGRIDARDQTSRPHQPDDVGAALHIGVGVCDAADAVRERAAGWTAEHAQRLDPLAQLQHVNGGRRRACGVAHGRSPAPGSGAARRGSCHHGAEKRTAGQHAYCCVPDGRVDPRLPWMNFTRSCFRALCAEGRM